MNWFKGLILALSSLLGVLVIMFLVDFVSHPNNDPVYAALKFSQALMLLALAIILWSLGVRK